MKYGLTQKDDPRIVNRHAHRFNANSISETNQILRFIIRRTTFLDSTIDSFKKKGTGALIAHRNKVGFSAAQANF